MILRLDGVVCWCGAWFLVLFCYLIGDSYSSSANGRNGTWVLVRRWFPSFGCLVPGIGRTGWFRKGGSSGGLLTPTKNQPQGPWKVLHLLWGDQINTNQTHGRFLGFLRGGWGSRGGHTGMICPHPQAIEHQGRMAQSALDESQRRQAWRLRPCCWEGLAWLAFKEIRGISPWRFGKYQFSHLLVWNGFHHQVGPQVGVRH